ncbi:cytochrome P450 [Annulohypoxylon maeteangense]|uniref:cytochrome P450 n=1 Tax=Annulohypoxylon maeteangense TaxID=1927788 RepID=UPI0020089709|nr:cytochrome P450 [Annulohypoxylon maeteangense]KAI0887592.1 cytochrome P450 [Annulohypoxylon maeteangense]
MAPPLPIVSPVSATLAGALLVTLYLVGVAVYRIFLHPLRKFPGPLLWKISPLPRVYHLMIGDLPFKVLELQAKYGKFVRLTPNELACNDPQAWKDIYGHRTGGLQEMPKYKGSYFVQSHLPPSIIEAEREEHNLIRRQLSHGFSEKSLRGQESIIGDYVNLLIQRLHEHGKNGTVPLNMREWFNWTTFDIIGDLGFGSSFDCLQHSDYHPWVKLIGSALHEAAAFRALGILNLRPVVDLMNKLGGTNKNNENMDLVRNKVHQRMKLGMERPDFMEGLIRKKNEWQMDDDRLAVNANVVIIAGSETTATLLSGAVYLLTTNRDKLDKLVQEVRSSFKSDEEITLLSVNNLSYMLACLNEAFRMYPPVAADLPRTVPKGGATIGGKYVAENTVVSVWQWAINRNPQHWTEPEKYIPERWLGDPKYQNDALEAMQPFSFGPRNCIGRNLAYAEMRLILARIIYNFDMSICDDSLRWIGDQKTYLLWDKPSLNLYMTPVPQKVE